MRAIITKTLSGSGLLLGGGLALGRETLIWGWNKLLDIFATALGTGTTFMSGANVPWLDIIGLLAIVTGTSLLIPWNRIIYNKNNTNMEPHIGPALRLGEVKPIKIGDDVLAERQEYANLLFITLKDQKLKVHLILTNLNRQLRDSGENSNRFLADFIHTHVIEKHKEAWDSFSNAIDAAACVRDLEKAMAEYYSEYLNPRVWVVKIPLCLGNLEQFKASKEFSSFLESDKLFFDSIRQFTLTRPWLRRNTVESKLGPNLEEFNG